MQKGNIKNKSGLIRCEFIEFLLRVCDEKYLKNSQFKTYAEAFSYLLNEKIKPNYQTT